MEAIGESRYFELVVSLCKYHPTKRWLRIIPSIISTATAALASTCNLCQIDDTEFQEESHPKLRPPTPVLKVASLTPVSGCVTLCQHIYTLADSSKHKDVNLKERRRSPLEIEITYIVCVPKHFRSSLSRWALSWSTDSLCAMQSFHVLKITRCSDSSISTTLYFAALETGHCLGVVMPLSRTRKAQETTDLTSSFTSACPAG